MVLPGFPDIDKEHGATYEKLETQHSETLYRLTGTGLPDQLWKKPDLPNV